MFRPIQKHIAAFLIVCIITVSIGAFFAPKKAEAVVDVAGACFTVIAQLFAGNAAGAAKTTPALPITVWVTDLPLNTTAGQIAASGQEQSVRGGCLDAIFYFIAKVILDQMTASIVQWINSGFKGSPSFVTDPGQFFTNIVDDNFVSLADQIFFGSTTSELSQFLCSPFKFDLQIKFALNFSYEQTGGVPNRNCKISQIAGNIKGFENSVNEYVNGNFKEGGWERWFQMTQNSSSNIIGSDLEVKSAFLKKVGAQKELEAMQLAWGRGFQSATNKLSNGIKQIITPGATIENTLAFSLGSGVRQLELADNFNEIVGALFGQLLKQVIGPGGLLSTTKTSAATGGKSTVDRILAGEDGKTAADRKAGADGQITGTSSLSDIADDGGIDELLALNKNIKNLAAEDIATTSQSSTNYCSADACTGGPYLDVSSRANDRTKNGDMRNGLAVTEQQIHPWWDVDLGTTSDIYQIRIYPTTRLSKPVANLYAFISTEPMINKGKLDTLPELNTLVSTGKAIKLSYPGSIDSPPAIIDVLAANGGMPFVGKYVRIMSASTSTTERLWLAEVEVWGVEATTTTTF